MLSRLERAPRDGRRVNGREKETVITLLRFVVTAIALMAGAAGAERAAAGTTLDAIMKRGVVRCGVAPDTPGFSTVDAQGVRRGFDVDMCRAIAAAMFGDADKVKFVPTTTRTRFTALRSGEVDVLSRMTSWSLKRNSALALSFPAITFYDGTGFVVPRKLAITSARQLDGARVCLQPNTTTEQVVSEYFRHNGMKFTAVVIEQASDMAAAYLAGRCDTYANDRSSLAAIRARSGDPENHLVLPELISKEPLAVAVRKGDEEWADIVRWAIFATIEAEELGVTSANVDAMLASDDPDVKLLLGVTPGNGRSLGLNDRWAFDIVKQVGNYAEIHDRHLGPATALRLERGLNALWNRGGLLYAPPMR
jgi:general L-amino acid transport system substrate-binding protein